MEPETPDVESGISRRRMLKRIGAGAAIAWTAPVLSSFRTPAFAQGSPACSTCEVYVCNSLNPICGAGGPLQLCICSQATDSGCFCWADDICDNRPDCGEGGTCPAGQTCVSTCCDQLGGNLKCWDPCGASGASKSAVTRGQTGSGA